MFIFFLHSIYSLQISEFNNYEIAALENKTKEVLVQPVRGIIYDRNGTVIVNNIPSYDLIIKPWEIPNLDIFIKNISSIIELIPSEIDFVTENFEQKARYNRELILKKNLSKIEIARFEVRSFMFPNAFIDERYSRTNNYPHLFSHAIGYVGGINNEQISSILKDQGLNQKETIFSYSNGFLVGKTGIENKYDKKLRGLFGKKIYEVDARGKLVKLTNYILPKNGDNLFTSLDLNSHKVAYEKMNNRRGAVVAVDIESGSIVTYISTPSFSSNDVSNGISSKAFNALLNDPNKPFFDRAAQGRYSPASTIKPAIGLYGLEEKLIDWNFKIQDPGYFILPEDQRVYRGWKDGGHGEINLESAIIESSNTFFFSLAYESEIDDLIQHLANFGFGKNVCLDCFNPDKGLLPSPEWKMNNLNFGWFKGDSVNMGVGQGYLSATPIQLAFYGAFLSNKGSLEKLSILDIYSNKELLELPSNNISEEDWNRLHDSMIGVIESPKGTAKRLKNLKPYTIAAKSGTVELVSLDSKEDYELVRQDINKRDHAIMVAFGPMPNPKYAVSVVIENAESGGSVAGPVAVKVLNSLIDK
jgi:penicillin-binding protein 2